MRTLLSTSAGLLVLAVLPSHASDAVRLESQIERAVVYPNRADVKRVADPIALGPGTTRVVIPDLPHRLDGQSVRVEGSGDEGVWIRNVEVIGRLLESGSAEANRLEAAIDSLAWRIRHLEQRQAALSSARELLESIKTSRGDALAERAVTGSIDGEELRRSIAALVDAMATNGGDRVDLEREIETQRANRDRFEQELRVHQQRSGTRRHDVSVELWADSDASVSLTVLYTIQAAGWTPIYDVRVGADLDSIRLEHHALVQQRSGEDWTGVELELSTARPALGARLPELHDWWLALPVPRGSDSLYKRGGRGSEVETLVDTELPKAMSEGQVRTLKVAQISSKAKIELLPASAETHFTTRFRVAGRVDVPSDGEFRRLALASVELDGTFRYETVPKLSQHAFLVADVTNPTDHSLLPGETRVLLGDQFLGKGRLPLVRPGEDFTLALGADPSVRVERRLTERNEERANREGTERRNSTHYRIEVENYRPIPVDVRVLDQMPLSAAGELEVSRKDTNPDVLEEEDGRLRWDLTVPSGEVRVIAFGIEVRYPADRRPPNLP